MKLKEKHLFVWSTFDSSRLILIHDFRAEEAWPLWSLGVSIWQSTYADFKLHYNAHAYLSKTLT